MAKKRSRRRSSSTSKRVQVKTSNDSSSGMYCGCDTKGMGWIFLILGILYLFTDLRWITWWNISWWTIIFLIIGIKMVKK